MGRLRQLVALAGMGVGVGVVTVGGGGVAVVVEGREREGVVASWSQRGQQRCEGG
jgi:hypothetical protein